MITLREIAEQAGVSITTVSNVLHGHTKRVSPATIERVQALLKEHNYVTRLGLRALQSANSRLIGVVILMDKYFEYTLIGNYFYGQLVGALEPTIRKAGYFMMLYSSEDVEDIYHMAATWNVDGVIAISFSASAYQKLRKLTDKPVVGIDLYDVSGDDIYTVGLEDEEGAYQMTSFLTANGYTDIFFFANTDWGIDHNRWLGYRRAIVEAGLPCRRDHFLKIDTRRENRYRQYEDLLRHMKEDCAWFYSSDTYAIEAMGFLQERRYKIPDDIAVVGYDDEPYCDNVYPSLTTVHQDVAQKAIRAFGLLLQLIEGEPVTQRVILLPTSLVVRHSARWIGRNGKDSAPPADRHGRNPTPTQAVP